MRRTSNLAQFHTPAQGADPRETAGAEIIDLATRNVLPLVSRPSKRGDWSLVAGIAIVAGLGAVTLWSMDNGRVAREQVKVPLQTPAATAAPSLALRPTDPRKPLPLPPFSPAGQPALAAPPPHSVLAAPPQAGMAPNAVINSRGAPALVFDGAVGTAGLGIPGIPAGAGNLPGGDKDDFASRVGGIGGAAATATAGIDPKTTVTQGTLIPAVLETAIDTDVPGYTRAIVSTDVRSFDGTRVLIPRSSRLIGQYKSGMQAGQKRAYVIWSRLIRPDGVTVNIASPSVAFSGETGLAGKVNTHFFERFGSAMLLSVVGGLASLGNGATAIIAGGGQSAAATAVGQNGQIGPTIRVRQGEPIRVFTARDLDFSKVSSQ